MAALIRKEPSHVTLEWLLRLMTHVVESDPEQFFIVDVVPNLRWLARNEHLVNNCAAELESFEHKVSQSPSRPRTLTPAHPHAHTPSLLIRSRSHLR